MATAPSRHSPEATDALVSACVTLAECAREVEQYQRAGSDEELVQFIIDVERASRIVDYLQVLAARRADERYRAGGTRVDPASPDSATPTFEAVQGEGSRNCAEFLRATLGISRAEARRRVDLAEVILPRISPTGATTPARLETLGAAMGACLVSGRAATIITQALQRVQPIAAPHHTDSMENHLTRQAMESDEDILRILARRWESVLDQDGQEPSEKVLRARQGVFLKGRHHGLHVLEIGATDEQFEHLTTVVNSATNPRTPFRPIDTAAPPTAVTGPSITGADGTDRAGTGATGAQPVRIGATAVGAGTLDDPQGPTRPQLLLDGLVAACRIALTTAALPSTGGHRPQVMVTIDYRDLTGATQHPGQAVFSQQISARTVRRLACDADIIPLVLGGAGQVLDIGRAQRLFPPHLRRALVARDKGCAFPDCSIPAPWCEAHHMDPWSRGGTTSVTNGVLLCSRHHHLIHQGEWTVEPRRGIPWFVPPDRPGRAGRTRRNPYWQAGRTVHEELEHDRASLAPDRSSLAATGAGPL